MHFRAVSHVRRAALGVACLLALGVSTHAVAQGAEDSASVRNAVQAAIDHTDAQAGGLSDDQARSAYRTAMQAAITQSGARPKAVQAALSSVVCHSTTPHHVACDGELASLLQQVIKLAEADINNGDVSSVRRALVAAVASLGGAPITAGGGGSGASYTTR